MNSKKLLITCFIFTLLFSSCNKNENSSDKPTDHFSSDTKIELKKSEKNEKKQTVIPEHNPMILNLDEGNNVSFESLQTFMKPDYTPEYAENPEDKEASNSKIASNGKKSDSVIPGTRKLGEYMTKYSSERKITFNKNNQQLIDDSDDNDKVFLVEDWGPQGHVPSQSENPSFYVVFSKPVHALAALEEPTDKSDILSIEPAIKGVFRWYGTKHLAFEASEPADPAIEYRIIVNPKTKSISGAEIKGQTTFRTTADKIEIKRMYGGYMEKGESAYTWTTGALPPYENRFFLMLNYKITEERLKEILNVKIGTRNAEYTSKILFSPESDLWGFNENFIKYNLDEKKSNSFIITVTDNVPHNASITASIKYSNSSETYETLKPFEISEVEEYTDYSYGQKQHPLTIRFSQTPDMSTIVDNISFDFDYKLTEDNFEISERNLILYNLPIDFDEKHKITFNTNIKDVFGQNLILKTKTYNFTVKNALAYVKFLDYGSKMLEAQFPHKMVFEYQNLEANSYYKIQGTDNPFDLKTEYQRFTDVFPNGNQTIPTDVKNKRQFMEIDFDPYLKNGYGFVKFDSFTTRRYYDNWDEQWEYDTDNHPMTIQVTDLGITARLGINRAVLLVRSLSSGKPVANAQVNILLGQEYSNRSLNSDSILASGTTDENGLCIIEYTEEQIIRYEYACSNNYTNDSLIVDVINGDDRAAFIPDSHSTWNFNVNNGSRSKVRKPQQQTFMFVDRGLYKPGETVTFRGIDKDQLLGTLKSHTGTYSISFKSSSWNAPDIMEPILGETSESGGFYGTIKLPDDLEPGSYEIKYTRTDNSVGAEPCSYYITVAEFERLKIQAGIKVPDITYYGGDKLSSELSAEYLAGGSLNGAAYTASWFKQGTSFEPDTPETKDYNFGPYNQYSGRTYYSEDQGVLSTSGSAQLGCNSEKITDGKPYQYRVEASVTDVSNQQITTAASVFVHPALYYVGLKNASNISGFAKKGQKLYFPYILTDIYGNLLQTKDIDAKVSDLSYSLSRDDWTMVHEQSVYSNIYQRYQKTTIEESSGSVKIDSAGSLEITPENTGWYTLQISGKDSKNNPVITSIGFYVTGSGMSWYGSDDSEEITLTPNQNLYNPGDTAQILLQSPLQKGDYLITVEREGIFTQEVRHFNEPANVIEVPIAGNYVPVVYVSVSSYSDRVGTPNYQYGETDLDKPKGYFGVTAINVNPYVRAFSVDIESSKKSYRPGEEATITLTARKGGKPLANAELTVMAVDRGVLDLINYHVSNPIDFFYNSYKYPLCVKGGDSRALLMDPVTYSVKNLAGGDAEAASDEEKDNERKDFRPTAVFEPVIFTDENGQAKVTFTMPDSLTTYRITAFGVKEDLFALQEDEVKVQNPINVQQVQPRKLRERDTAECGVLITNLDSESQRVTVSLETRSPTKNTKEDELAGRKTIPGKAYVDGKNEHTVMVAAGDSTVVYFDVGAEKEGTVELVYSIKSELLNEKLISPIKIEKTYVYETVTMIGSTDNQDVAKSTEALIIPGFAKDGKGALSVTLDATRLGMLGGAVNYLFDYPYGCLEQQSSRVLPLVLFEDYIDVFGLDSKVKDIKTCVKNYTSSWAKVQLEDGSFPYWPDGTRGSLYVSIRIAHICAAAIQRGYSRDELEINLRTLSSYIAKEVTSYTYTNNDYLKAYACYVMKLLGYHNLDNELNNLYRKIDSLTLSAAAYVSLAFAEDMGLSSLTKASEINKIIRPYLQPVERSVTILDPNRKDDYWFWYESPAEQMAIILQAFVKVDPNDQMVDRLLFTLMKNQSMGYWKNTASTAKVLEAIYTYIKMRNLDNTDFTGSAKIDGKSLMTEAFTGVGAKPKTLVLPFENEIISGLEKDKTIPITFEKNGPGQLYYTAEMKYALPDEMQCARDEGLKIVYTISDYETGEEIKTSGSYDSLLTLESGKLYKATVRVESIRNRTYVALRSPIPSGAEILDSTFVTTSSKGETSVESEGWGHWLSNKTIYDNEIQFFWDNFNVGSSTVSFTFRATRRGIYPTPPVQAECMYEPEIFGRSDGYLFQIK